MIFVSVRPSIAVSILLEACKRDMKWPNYVWILHSYRLEELLNLANSSHVCGKSSILDGIFTFQLVKELKSDANSMQKSNPFGALLQDAIWALAFAASNKPFYDHTSFMDAVNGHAPTFAEIYIYQALNLSAELIGVYSDTSKSLTHSSRLGAFTYDGPVLIRVRLNTSVLVISIVCLLFNTFLLILFICFRNHPDVKSTNVSLSILIFIACYLFIGYAILEFFGYHTFVEVCMVNIWISGIGLSLALVMATVLVKMLQVYRIFTLMKRMKSSLYTKYVAPIIYVLLILSPCIVILVFWTAIDPFRITITYVEHPGFVTIAGACDIGVNYPIWYALVISYQMLLCLATVCVAVKTRKIRLSRFKDTKKVNVFIFLMVFIGITSYSYWLVLRFIDPDVSSRTYVLIVVHIVAAFTTQFTLFVPKLWTPLKEKVTWLVQGH